MCSLNIVLWCFVLLLVASFSKSQENTTNDNERSDYSTIRYDHLVSSMKYENDEMETTQCNSCDNSIKNDEIQYELSVNSTKSNHKNDDSMQYKSHEHITKNHEEINQMSMESRANFTEINSTLQEINEKLRKKAEDESNSTNSNKFYENSSTDDYNNSAVSIVSFEKCHGITDITCIQLCCPFGNNMTEQGKCIAGQDNYSFPSIFTCGNDSEDTRLNKLFRLTVRDPCVLYGHKHKQLDGYIFLANGSLFQGPDKLISRISYCLAIFERNFYDVFVCTNQTESISPHTFSSYISVCFLVSLPFLLLTFVVYSILPELQNVHGYTLRAHVASLFVMYAIICLRTLIIPELVESRFCIPLAYILNFSALSSFFWLNVTCFDIWWTFKEFRLSQMKQDKKKFVMYSLYAWGITFIINVICAIMDYVPGIPENLIRPEMCKKKFWFSEKAKMVYFFIPVSVTIISNICFFIATMVTILCQNIHTTNQLRDSESMRHNENKQRFNMYLKLFIVMGISWIMELIQWFFDFMPAVISDFSDIINSLQGVIFFTIFVCRKKIKKKIKQLLLKKFGRNCGPFCRKIPTNNRMASTTSSLASRTLSMQEISSSSSSS